MCFCRTALIGCWYPQWHRKIPEGGSLLDDTINSTIRRPPVKKTDGTPSSLEND